MHFKVCWIIQKEIWVDQGSELCTKSYKKWIKENDIEMYSTHNKRKIVAAERFFRTLKNKICKQMIAVSKNVYFDVRWYCWLIQ